MDQLGMLGIDETYEGLPGTKTRQRFSSGSLEVGVEQLLLWGVGEVSDTSLQFTATHLALLHPSGAAVLKGELWRQVDPASCSWSWTPGKAVVVQLPKQPECLGSWPRLFRRLSLGPAAGGVGSNGPADAAVVGSPCLAAPTAAQVAAEAWDDEDVLHELALRKEEHQTLTAAFLRATTAQLAPPTSLRDLQTGGPHTVLLFTGDPSACSALLQEASSLPGTQQLLALARQLAGVDLPADLQGAGALSTDPAVQAVACLVAGLAAVELLSLRLGVEAVRAADGCAGSGCGEYAALVFAGCLTVQQALVLAQDHDCRATPGTSSSSSRTGSSSLERQQQVLDSLSLRQPRMAVVSGSNAKMYASAAAVRRQLLRAARRPLTPALLQAALAASGCELVLLQPAAALAG